MAARVMLKDKTIRLIYIDEAYPFATGAYYEIGHQLFALLWMDLKPLDQSFTSVIQRFAACIVKEEISWQPLLNEAVGELSRLGDYCAYLDFYAQDMLKAIFKVLREAVGYEPYEVVYEELMLERAIILDRITATRARLFDELEKIDGATTEPGFAALTPLQRLYALDTRRSVLPLYIDRPFVSRFAPEDSGVPLEAVEIVEMTDIEDIEDLARFELLKLLNLQIPFKKCKHCGCYFIPIGRSDAEYCPRVFQGETKPCSEIGATRRYKRKTAGNPTIDAFNKVYRRNHSRVRYHKMGQQEFYDWSETARKKRDACLAGNLPLDEFRAWLEQ